LGLAITKRAVRLHGGSVRALNRPGTGLLVEIKLPLVAQLTPVAV
jgi:signal transduction histidine kinase